MQLFALDQCFASTPRLLVKTDYLPDSTEPALRLDAPPEGGRLYFSGASGMAGGAKWRADSFLVLPIYQNTGHSIFFHLHFWETATPDDACHADIAMGVFPGFTVQVALPLSALELKELFLPRTPGRLKNVSLGTPLSPAQIRLFALEIPPSASPCTVWLGTPRIADTVPDYIIPDQTVVDELGQWTRKDWPGKTHGGKELVTNLKHWATEPDEQLGGPYDTYGGWMERRFEATGFFRTGFDGRWWLIDPAGHPFLSVGPDCVSPFAHCPVEGLESLHAWLPGEERYSPAWRNENGRRMFCFSTANLIRAFGANWLEEWERMTGGRLRRWGFNTIANWSRKGLGPRLRMPYVTQLSRFPTTKSAIFRDFPDVFAPEYGADAKECATELLALKDDPFMIGYFLRNEPHWGFGDYNIAELLLAHADNLAGKEHLIKFLSHRHAGDITKLADAWRHSFASFTELLKPLPLAASLSPAAKADLDEFTRVLIDEYVRVPAEAARQAAPNHLNLGMRWAWIASDAFYAGSRYCDVFSINMYKLRPDEDQIRAMARASGLPVMIGEFHAGALDAGLPSTGLRGVASQGERGKFYRWYVEHAAAMPEIIGAHYFQWGDQPVLGRFDGENCNIGLVDVCHRPYDGLVKAAAATHRRLYAICAGLLSPVAEEPKEVPPEGF